MKRLAVSLIVVSALAGCGSGNRGADSSAVDSGGSTTIVSSAPNAGDVGHFTAEVWADNWFSLYVNGDKVGEDSVPITTERSFNSETISFEATYPFTVGLVAKDFVENASGLEYIGTDRQQMGDGGLIVQITDDSGRVVAVSNGSWKAFVTAEAPLNPECEKSSDPTIDCKSRVLAEPDGWASAAFDDTSWSDATTFSADEVGPKDGYNDISWDSSAQFVWGPNLKTDNIVLVRTTVSG